VLELSIILFRDERLKYIHMYSAVPVDRDELLSSLARTLT